MATNSNNFDGNLLLDDGVGAPASTPAYFGFGRSGAQSTGPRIYAVSSTPNGVLTAPIGSLAINSSTGALYQNTNGATAWSVVASGGGGLGPLPDNSYLVMGTDSDGEIGFSSGSDAIVCESLTRAGTSSAGVIIRTGAAPAATSGSVDIVSGTGIDTGDINLTTGVSSADTTGSINLTTGNATGNSSGDIIGVTGSSSNAATGRIEWRTASAVADQSGGIILQTGNGTAGNASSGDIEITTGSKNGSGARGDLLIDVGNVYPQVPVTGTIALAATASIMVPYVLDVADTATGSITFSLPFAIEIAEVVVVKKGSAGDPANTIQLLNGATPLTNAMTLPTNAGEVVRPSSLSVASGTTTGTTLTVAIVRSAGSSACRMYISGVRR